MESDAANAARCQGRAGAYEAWYVTVNEPATRHGSGIPYPTFRPARGVEAEAHSALGGFRFDHENPGANWGAKAVFPLSSLKVQGRPFALRLDDALLVHNGCSGEIESDRGTMRWDLR